jgi:cytochrome P450
MRLAPASVRRQARLIQHALDDYLIHAEHEKAQHAREAIDDLIVKALERRDDEEEEPYVDPLE